jgi:hypothetical protein
MPPSLPTVHCYSLKETAILRHLVHDKKIIYLKTEMCRLLNAFFGLFSFQAITRPNVVAKHSQHLSDTVPQFRPPNVLGNVT